METRGYFLFTNLIIFQWQDAPVPASGAPPTIILTQEMIMVGENLGSIPPNTALMIVNDGEKRYQVYLTSDNKKNAMVRFIYEKPK